MYHLSSGHIRQYRLKEIQYPGHYNHTVSLGVSQTATSTVIKMVNILIPD